MSVSREELAIVERSNMGKIERGENNLSVLKLIRIADALGGQAAKILANAKL